MTTKTITWVTRWRLTIASVPTLPGVWKRKEGGFVVRGSAKDPRTGALKEVFKVLGDERDPKAAFAWLTNERAKIRAGGLHATTSCPRFSSFAASLMAEKIRNGDLSSAATRGLWADVLEDHLLQAPFASFLVDQIRVRDILDWKATIKIGESEGEFSPHTANVWLRILRVIVNAYVAKYELERNPMLAVELFDTSRWRGRITKEQPNSLTPDELPLFLAKMRTAFPQFFAMVALGFALGARPSTLRPLGEDGCRLSMAAERVGVTASTACHHLRLLLRADLVVRQYRGRSAIYRWGPTRWTFVRERACDEVRSGESAEPVHGLRSVDTPGA